MTSWLSARGGGVPAAMLPLVRVLRRRDVKVSVIALHDGPTPQGCHDATVLGPRAVGFAPAMAASLRTADADLVHLHGLWMYPSLAVLRWSRAFSRPRIISPHGMLDPWALAQSPWKKKLALSVFERQNLEGAACLHALNSAEAEALRAFGLRNPIAVIPNGVDLPAEPKPWDERSRKVLLFLGRIHPKKGIYQLQTAWAKAAVEPGAANWRLAIAGWDDGGHLSGLMRQAAELGISETIDFLGPLFGDAKAQVLQNADAFILPSLSEGLPMAVLEAWSYSLPVLMTKECNIPEGFAANAALRISTQPDRLADSLRIFFALRSAERLAMGEAGRRLVEHQFTWDRIAADMHEIYAWILGGSSVPSCIKTD